MINLHDVLIVLLTSAATVGAVTFILKRLVDRSIEHGFRLREMATESKLNQISGAQTALFGQELLVYPEIIEVVYRSRNAARACAEQKSRTRAVLTDFNACKVHMSENLYKYRLFIPDSEFRKLHRFKSELQEFAVLLDEVTRSTMVADTPVDPRVRELANGQLVERFAVIDQLHTELIPELQRVIRSKVDGHSYV